MTSDIVCGPLPIFAAVEVLSHPDANNPVKQHYISLQPKEWPSHSTISYAFVDNAPHNWQVRLVEDAISEYTRYANVNLIRSSDEASPAEIRISFKSDCGAWSAIGTDALKISSIEPTMNLDFLSMFDERGPTTKDENEDLYNYTLHEFGHAFGLMHEWDGSTLPDRTQHTDAFKQIREAYGSTKMSNFMHQVPDEDSIMRFFFPSSPRTGVAAVKLTGGLSENDKAWLTLMYPGKVNAVEDNGILRSLNVLGVPVAVSSQILLSSSVSEIRYHYRTHHANHMWEDGLISMAVHRIVEKMEVRSLVSKPHELKAKVTGTTPLIDHNSEDDLYDTVAAAVLDPQFTKVLANVVNKDGDGAFSVQQGIFNPLHPNIGIFTPPWLPPGIISSGISPQPPPDVQHFLGALLAGLGGLLLGNRLRPRTSSGLPVGAAAGIYPHASGINPQVPPDVQNFLGPLLAGLGGILGPLIFSGLPTSAAAGVYPQALPPDVEQGIWNVLVNAFKHPIFINTVKGVASDMLEAHNKENKNAEEGKE